MINGVEKRLRPTNQSFSAKSELIRSRMHVKMYGIKEITMQRTTLKAVSRNCFSNFSCRVCTCCNGSICEKEVGAILDERAIFSLCLRRAQYMTVYMTNTVVIGRMVFRRRSVVKYASRFSGAIWSIANAKEYRQISKFTYRAFFFVTVRRYT